jgi:LytS/YehU family sensor histidine kinase
LSGIQATTAVIQLKVLVAPFKRRRPDPVVRFETAPGEQLQADFTYVRKGKDPLLAFVATLGYSRATFVRFTRNESATTLGHELQLVRAYLELMHMRMPDRLQFTLHADEGALALHCPPMTLLTLVENAVHHGIDPSEDGGRIDVGIQRRGDRCLVRVSDTGAGLRQSGNGLGTGLTTLRERLALTFGGDVHVRVSAQHPNGVSAEVDFPVRGTEP